jgi:KaiC/GvpD/RAD55 family RecA-like ATPase
MAEVERLLECAAGGQGGVLVITGPPGSGRTELAAAAAKEGARRGFEVLRTAVMQYGWRPEGCPASRGL